MKFDSNKSFAKKEDIKDQLKHFREKFYIPKNKSPSKRTCALEKRLCGDASQIVQKQIPAKQADVSVFF